MIEDNASGGIDPKVLARVRGLLAKAENTDYPEEAESFTAHAITLMSKYGISERAARQRAGTQRTMTEKAIVVDGAYVTQQKTLIGQLAAAYGVYTLFRATDADWQAYSDDVRRYNDQVRSGWVSMKKPTRPKKRQVTLYGYDTDIERTEYLFTSLLLQAHSMLAKVTAVPSYYSANLRSYRTSYYEGWINRVAERVREAEAREVEEVATSTALVVVSPLAQAEQFALSGLDKRPAKRSKRTVWAGAWEDGQAAGERADIGLTRVGEERRALTG